MANALAPVMASDEFEVIQRTARMLAVSGYFDAKGEGPIALAQVATKIIAGRELGFGPFAAVNGIYIIQGRPAVGANLMAAAVKGGGRYDYRVREMTPAACRIEFFQRVGDRLESLGMSEFTAEDARKAQTKNMDKFPKNMLFARAMSNGVRWFCPDVFSGNAVYVPEELGADVDGEGNVIEVQGRVVNVDTGEIHRNGNDGPPPADNPFDGPTDAEIGVLSTWRTPEDAQRWAVEDIKTCANVHEARNSFAKIVGAHGGKLTKANVGQVYLDYLRRQYEKRNAQPEPA